MFAKLASSRIALFFQTYYILYEETNCNRKKNSSPWILIEDIHYDPLMMSQKEAPRKHPWVLPRKVAYLV